MRWIVETEPSPSQIDAIASMLAGGGVVLMPTDTIYGLHALADSAAAERIAVIKGRDAGKRFVTLASSVAQAESFGVVVPDVLRQIWPAPVTAILQRGSTTVAMRIPDVAWLRDLLERTGPLVSTSANRSGEAPITLPDELARDLQSMLDGIVDGGRRSGEASAIVDFTGDRPQVVREGDPRFSQILRKSLRKTL